MQMHCKMKWLLLIAFLGLTFNTLTCPATKIFYVLPDVSTKNISCPSVPCFKLSHYLSHRNDALLVKSNVEYHFLPGYYYLTSTVMIHNGNNLLIKGHEQRPNVTCSSHFHVVVLYSNNITIENFIFTSFNATTNAISLDNCKFCKINHIYFFLSGLKAVNLFNNSILYNVSITGSQEQCTSRFCGIFLEYNDIYYHRYNDSLVINRAEFYSQKITIKMRQDQYNMTIMVNNSCFSGNNEVAIDFETKYSQSANTFIMHSCLFTSNNNYAFAALVPDVLSTLIFDKCNFTDNKKVLSVSVKHLHHFCLLYASNIILQDCKFSYNWGQLLNFRGVDVNVANMFSIYGCKANVYLRGSVSMVHTNMINVDMVSMHNMTFILDGSVMITHNHVGRLMVFGYSNVIFSKNITFKVNFCDDLIVLLSDLPYVTIMEHINLIIHFNGYESLLTTTSDYYNNNPYPLCLFQYVSKTNKIVLPTHYTIIISGWYTGPKKAFEIFSFFLTSHCRWLPSAVFKAYHPGPVNKQIIKQYYFEWSPIPSVTKTYPPKPICYCYKNGTVNCSVDVLGPIYPGQQLNIYLCDPFDRFGGSEILFVEMHSKLLPESACKVAHHHELIQTINKLNQPPTVNFTIVSEVDDECELFLTAEPYLYKIYSGFYVKLMRCPPGFTLQDGVCNCDPILYTDDVHIDTCDIDQPAIHSPANTWITHTNSNNTKYLVSSNCPMDYCLPHSSHLNLHNPDLQCQFNRTGMLCSQCQHSLSTVFGSSRCMKCTNVHILITLIVIVAGIVLVVLLYLLNLTVTNGTITGIIFYANVISINDSVFLVNDNVFKPLRVFISFANLDLGIETCFYNGMDTYAKMWLQLFFPFYLIIIATIIIISSRYSSRILRLTYTRSLPVLATLFLLSYTSVLRAVLTVLFSYSTITKLPSGDQQLVWSIDASVPLFGLKFTILFITCLVLFLLLIPFNIILLFTRYLSQFRIINRFKPLLDAYQGSYKDKYYYWIGVDIILRSLFFALYALQSNLRLILSTMILIAFDIAVGCIYPYKSRFVNIQNLSLLFNLTILYAVSYQGSGKIFSFVTNVMISLAFIQFCSIVFYHFLTYTCHCNVVNVIQVAKEKITSLCADKNSNNDIELLGVPERTYNYNEYQDGLVSDDFN